MENSEEIAVKISSILDDLPHADDTVAVLEELRIAVSAVSPDLLAQIVPNVSMNVVFGCISQNDSEQVGLCCEILNKLLDSFHASTLLNEFEAEIIQGLILGTKPVKIMCLQQVHRLSLECPEELVTHTDILLKSVHCLADDDISLAAISRKIAATLGCVDEWSSLCLSGVILEELLLLLERGSVVRFRVYEMVVDLSILSQNTLSKCSTSGILSRLVDELTGQDVLSQLNCLELLSVLASVEHGLNYLQQQGVVSKLESMMENCENDPMMNFLLPGLMKFFGHLARRDPHQTCDRHRSFLDTVFSCVDERTGSMVPVAVETLAFIAENPGGKIVLDTYNQGTPMKAALKTMGALIRDAPTEIRGRALNALRQLIDLTYAQQDERTLEISERWFRHFTSKPMDLLLSLSAQPFTELRWAALRLLNALARQKWGRIELNNHAGFNEYLLNRSTEKEKIGKELKFEIVKTLLEAKDVDEIFGKPYVVKLKVFEKEGPFFVRAQAEVAMENQS